MLVVSDMINFQRQYMTKSESQPEIIVLEHNTDTDSELVRI